MFLSRSITVYLPNPKSVPDTVINSWITKFQDLFIDTCGGCTRSVAHGLWKDKNYTVCFDNLFLIKAFCRISDYASLKTKVKELVQICGRELNQEAIAVEWHDGMEIIDILPKSS